ncbi:MAG: hypothetical protein JWL82_617 [Parcubacteria group bacterium]|nr:hypothetical protein [Parcubacteria group bacterium]
MTAIISDEDATKASSKAEDMGSYRKLIDTMLAAVMEVRPRFDRLDTKTWLEMLHAKGVRVHGREMWVAIFREETGQETADSIIKALCTD